MRLGPCVCGGLGVVRADVDADADIISADAKDAMAMSDDISARRVWMVMTNVVQKSRCGIGAASGWILIRQGIILFRFVSLWFIRLRNCCL